MVCGTSKEVYTVELYARVRRAVVVDKMSEREAARQFGLARETVPLGTQDRKGAYGNGQFRIRLLANDCEKDNRKFQNIAGFARGQIGIRFEFRNCQDGHTPSAMPPYPGAPPGLRQPATISASMG
jgi:hypothetical protein